ncbi:MAG: asparagine synthase (glutamine-hydrolyzing) [Pseudomonadota bacterium]
MCGFAGIVDLRGERQIDEDALARMSEALAHRGPDGDGVFVAPGVGLAHRRLSVIDIHGGAQPFTASTGSVLVFNGEIYNYRCLAPGFSVRLQTQSDTEVLAEGLAQKGASFLDEARGMFAFGFWNKARKTLMLARDRLGEKPLFYGQTEDGFLVFASELNALVQSRMFDTTLSVQAVADYFMYGYIPDPKTIYNQISKLPPGSTLIAERGQKLRLSQYWRPSFHQIHDYSFEDAAEELRERIDATVKAQMISDVPLGAFLSGGVDSASIVSSLAQSGADPITCTVGFEETEHDERAPARAIADRFNTSHHEHMASVNAEDLIDKIALHFGEPFADSSALPTFLLSKLARQHVTVALSGDGGDEVFAGYRRYPFFLNEERVRTLAPLALRRLVFGAAGAVYPKLDWAPRPFRAKTTLQALAVSRSNAYARAAAAVPPERVSLILSADARAALNGYDPLSVVADAIDKADTDDPLAAAQFADMTTWLPGRMLTKVDRMSMAHGLEVRPPLLDQELVSWTAGLPSRFKLADGERKRVLKAAMRNRLGDEHMSRKKRGFEAPVSAWFRQPNSFLANRVKTSDRWRNSDLIDSDTVDTMLNAHQNRTGEYGQELWSVLMFDAFLRASEI